MTPPRRASRTRQRPDPVKADDPAEFRWYRARQAVFDGPGHVLRRGSLFRALPSDPRVRAGLAVPDAGPGPSAEVAAALAEAEEQAGS